MEYGATAAQRPQGPLDAPTHVPSLREKELLGLVEGRFREAEEARRSQEESWLQCVSFVAGKQWHRYNWNTGALELPRAPSWRVRATHNLLRVKVADAVAALVGDLPLLEVEPMSSQPQDQLAARTGKQLLHYLHERLRWEKMIVSLARWLVMCGTGWVKTYWDPNQIDRHAVPVGDPQPLLDESGAPVLNPITGLPETQQMLQGVPGKIGQIGTCFVSPFEMYRQPGAQSWEQVEWCIHAKVRSLDYIRANYPETGRFVRGEAGGSSHAGYMERRVADILEARDGGSARGDDTQAVVLEYWEKPCPDYPQGRQITVCNGVVLRDRVLPYRHLVERGMLPFTCFVYESLDLTVEGLGLAQDLIEPQREYNRIFSDLVGILKTTGIPKWLIPNEANLSPQALTTAVGEKIRYSQGATAGGGLKPELLQASVIPSQWSELLDRIKADMDDITRRHMVSAGSAPAGVTAGVSLQLLQDADNQAHGPVRNLFHESLSELGYQVLCLAKQFYDEARLGYVVGSDDQRALAAFSSTGLPDNADVRAVAASKVPMSRAARQQQLFDLYDRGVFGPPGSPEANKILLKRLEFGDVDQLYEEQLQAEAERQRQQMLLAMAQTGMQQQGQRALQQQRGDQAAQLQAQRGQQAAQQQAAGAEAQMALQQLRGQMQPAPPAPAGLEGLTQ